MVLELKSPFTVDSFIENHHGCACSLENMCNLANETTKMQRKALILYDRFSF